MGRRRNTEPSEKENHYRRLLAELAKSGVTLRSFAKGRGIPETTLAWWKHAIADRDRRQCDELHGYGCPDQRVHRNSKSGSKRIAQWSNL